ncbi:uncharacterized protein L201_003974 [Kwoniella dendrophila CBS 6074]|uniref:Altered inheritance of mitochondria protein 21 n=1 Tax=Kwoniella dendrophila CBS 6074 TaxID=1295534 RepID=A0AAX4JUE2_9TREE
MGFSLLILSFHAYQSSNNTLDTSLKPLYTTYTHTYSVDSDQTATMGDDSLTPPSGNSRSSSPSGQPQGRIVSGSLKDRIAKFNNSSAPPPIPKSQFQSKQQPSISRGGLVGNRIPSLDPKTAGMINSGGGGHPVGNRRISENRGLIGNRIPSMGSSSSNTYLQNQSTGSSNSGNNTPSSTIPKPSSGTTPTNPTTTSTASGVTGARSSSPSGSIDSSAATLESSNSPITSRSSSPPTSPGSGIPPSLLAASLPGLDDNGGPGATTPSSTRAEAGDTVSELSLSVPSTPLAAGTPPLPAAEYDLVAPNLKLATANAAVNAGANAANPMIRGLSAQSSTSKSFAPSISSSLATQSRGSEEETQMMQDVSGVSTPVGTPRAARRELGEGSVIGEGSVVGEGSVLGDNDVEELGNKLDNLQVKKPETEDRELTPEPHKEKLPDIENLSEDAIASEEASSTAEEITDVASNTSERGEPIEEETQPEITISESESDPNKASDLDDLKAGKLSSTPDDTAEKSEKHHDSHHHSKRDSDPNLAPDLADLKAGRLSPAPSKESHTEADEKSEAQPDSYHSKHKSDPNQAPDLADLKAGKLGAAGDENRQESGPEEQPSQKVGLDIPANAMVGDSHTQNLAEHDIPLDEVKKQGGEAGQHIDDVETADQVIEPGEEESQDISNYNGGINEKEGVVHVGPGETEIQERGTKKSELDSVHMTPSKKDDDGDHAKERGSSNETKNEDKSNNSNPYLNENDRPKNDDPDLINPTYKGDDSESAKQDPYKPENKQSTLQEAAKPIKEIEKNDQDNGDEYDQPKNHSSDRNDLKQDGDDVEMENTEFRSDEHQDRPTQDVDPVEVTSSVAENVGESTQPTNVEVPPTPNNANMESTDQKEEIETKHDTSSRSLPEDDSPSTPKQEKTNLDAEQVETKTEQPRVSAIGDQVSKDDVTSTSSSEPKQLHVEPAPIAQPASEDEPFHTAKESITAETSSEAETSIDRETPSFPEPPTADPDIEDPISTPAELEIPPNDNSLNNNAVTTPIDGTFLKSFPDVPDEDKPRVEVHVSSPITTPQKSKQPIKENKTEDSDEKDGGGEEFEIPNSFPNTPIANIPGKSKSLSNSRLSVSDPTEEELNDKNNDGDKGEGEEMPQQIQTLKSSGSLSKRLSTRHTPKSPLLDDEDPGDFEPGEGWAVVTK